MQVKADDIIYKIKTDFCNDIYDVLWTITTACNQKCVYCFDTISKQKTDSIIKMEISDYFAVIDKIVAMGYKRIYFCGGEALLFKGIERLVEYAFGKKLECIVTTNLSYLNEGLYYILKKEFITTLGISLDSINCNINDFLRGNTEVVLSNIEKIVNFIKTNNLDIRIEILCTVSKVNINYILELFEWCKSHEIEYVALNPVSVSSDNAYYSELALDGESNKSIINLLDEIIDKKNKLFKKNVHDEMVYFFERLYLQHKDIQIVDCPVLTTKRYLYIEPDGKAYFCPLKKGYCGNIIENELTKKEIDKSMCQFFMQCLCYW